MGEKSSNTPGWMMFWGVITAAVGFTFVMVGSAGESRMAELVAHRGIALTILGVLVGLVGWILDVARGRNSV
jgi:hypothetical protein